MVSVLDSGSSGWGHWVEWVRDFTLTMPLTT